MNMVRPWSTMVGPWLDHGQWPWLTMVWQCFDHGWTMVDHGHVKWPPLRTMVDHVQATMVSSTFKNQMTWSESWSNTWCADIQINTPLGDEHGQTMVNHGWPWSGNVLTMVEPWLTMIRLYQGTMVNHGQFHIQDSNYLMVNHGQIQTCKSTHLWELNMVNHGWPWSGNVLTMVRLYQATMVWLWSTMVSSTFKNQMTMVNHCQIPDVQTFKSTHLWGMNMAEPWLTMVWQCCDHGWTMVDHGQVISGNHGLTMVSSTFKNQMTMVNHGQIPDVYTFKSIHLWGMNMAKPWSTMVDHGLAMFWPWLNHGWPWSGYIRQPWSDHGQPWSVPHSKIKWPDGQSWSNTDIQINTPLGVEHGWTMVDHGLAMFWPWLNHGWPWSG